jgi:hypothetical protein
MSCIGTMGGGGGGLGFVGEYWSVGFVGVGS